MLFVYLLFLFHQREYNLKLCLETQYANYLTKSLESICSKSIGFESFLRMINNSAPHFPFVVTWILKFGLEKKHLTNWIVFHCVYQIWGWIDRTLDSFQNLRTWVLEVWETSPGPLVVYIKEFYVPKLSLTEIEWT